jgi:uncharacterized protein YciI
MTSRISSAIWVISISYSGTIPGALTVAPMPGYVFRLIPTRPTFAFDMSEEERAAMVRHADYWRALARDGKVLAFGPVADPSGPYGIGIVVVDDLAAAEALRDGDPAARPPLGFRTEIAPMRRLVTPDREYDAAP